MTRLNRRRQIISANVEVKREFLREVNVVCAVTENQLFDFQRNVGIVRQSCASVASVVRQVTFKQRAFVPQPSGVHRDVF